MSAVSLTSNSIGHLKMVIWQKSSIQYLDLTVITYSYLSFRELEGSIQRYQWFFSELPEMLCESEMEVEQHTCWNGQEVVERCVCLSFATYLMKVECVAPS